MKHLPALHQRFSFSGRPKRLRAKRRPGLALVIMVTLALVLTVTVQETYTANHGYWLLYFGEHGPVAETALPIILMIITFWMRQILFPRQTRALALEGVARPGGSAVSGRDIPLAADSPKPLRVFQPLTRSPVAYWSFWLLLFLPVMVLYLVKMAVTYRWPTPITYYLGWTLPFACMCAWAWEVVWAVSLSYRRRRLEARVTHISQLYSLSDQLQQNTQSLIWSLGTFIFFELGFFGKFYLQLVNVMSIFAFLTLLFVSAYPWIRAYQRAEHLVRDDLLELDELRSTTQRQKYNCVFRSEEWVRCNADLSLIEGEMASLKELLAQFDFSKWLEERRKDLVPVTVLNLLSPYLTMPALQHLQQYFGQ